MDNPDIYDLISKLVSSLGFPIFVAVWLLVRTDRLISSLNTTMSLVQHTLEALGREINGTNAAMKSIAQPERRQEPD